jgi:hypothetical protein
MQVTILEEAGYKSAMEGLSLSHLQPVENMSEVAMRLSRKGEPHCKFMRQMHVWFEITAKWKWWKQMATYRIGVETQSDSTMNNIMDRNLTPNDFGSLLPGHLLDWLNDAIDAGSFGEVTDWLPGNYLYTRVVDFSYSALRNIIQQRHNHKLPEWKKFIEQVLAQVEHPEFLTWKK